MALGGNKKIYFWEINSHLVLRTLKAHKDWVQSLIFSPDGKILATGSQDKTIKLWDTKTRKLIKTLSGHLSWIASLAFSADGKYLASSSFDRTIKLWDVSKGKFLLTLSDPKDIVVSLIFSADGETLISSGRYHLGGMWNVRSGKRYKVLKKSGSWFSMIFSKDGRFLILPETHSAIIWDTIIGKPYKKVSANIDTTLPV